MNAAPTPRPRFTRAYITSLGKSFDERGFLALIPVWLLICASVAWSIAYYMPEGFWKNTNQSVAVVVYVGILTINGLILALSWSTFARIHECITADDFCAYLMENELLGDYVVYIGYVHAVQIIAIITSGAGLMVLLYSLPLLVERITFAAMLALSIYAIKQAANSVTVMHDLIWDKATFDRGNPKNSDEKVVRIKRE